MHRPIHAMVALGATAILVQYSVSQESRPHPGQYQKATGEFAGFGSASQVELLSRGGAGGMTLRATAGSSSGHSRILDQELPGNSLLSG